MLPQPVSVTGDAPGAPLSRSTQRAYLGHWTRFRSWAQEQGLGLPEGLEAALCDYLVRLAEDGKRMATIRQARAAIIRGTELAGWPKPGGSGVAEMMRGLGRILRGPQKQAAPLHAEALAAIRATAFTRRRTRGGHTEAAEYARRRGLVDVALASVMRDGLLRVSEAAALRWADKGIYFIWDFTQLNVRPHSRVGLLKYKTAPKCSLSGPFRHSGVGRNPGAVGPVRSYNLNFTYPYQPALGGGGAGRRRQRPHPDSGVEDRPGGRGGGGVPGTGCRPSPAGHPPRRGGDRRGHFGIQTSTQTPSGGVCSRQRGRLGSPAGGTSPGTLGGLGWAQDLSAAGFALPELMTAGRWKSPRMPARYTERQAAGRGAVARYYQGGRG